MNNRFIRSMSVAILAVTVLATGWVILAQPARDRILDSASVTLGAEHVLLEIRLTAPFRYLSHFPLDSGRELRIRIQPVQVAPSDRDALFKREAVVPPDADVALVDQIIYEGDSPDGPWLTVRFTRRVRYQVIPDADYRGINIEVQQILQ